MHNWAYTKIFEIIKDAKGYTLEDLPRSFHEIMRAFDNNQNQRSNGIQIVLKLISDTKLWLGIIQTNIGRDSPKYIVSSNSLSHACIILVDGVIDRLINLAILSDFQPIRGPDIQNQVSDAGIALKRIGELYMVHETRLKFNDLLQKLQFLQALISISFSHTKISENGIECPHRPMG